MFLRALTAAVLLLPSLTSQAETSVEAPARPTSKRPQHRRELPPLQLGAMGEQTLGRHLPAINLSAPVGINRLGETLAIRTAPARHRQTPAASSRSLVNNRRAAEAASLIETTGSTSARTRNWTNIASMDFTSVATRTSSAGSLSLPSIGSGVSLPASAEADRPVASILTTGEKLGAPTPLVLQNDDSSGWIVSPPGFGSQR